MMLHKKIAELIKLNPHIAATLHFLGIHFHHYSEKTLAEACQQKGLNVDMVVQHLAEAGRSKSPSPIELVDYPIDLILEYLKHNHFLFIKEKLPYISKLVQNLDENVSELAREIKFVYPLFLAELIEHIYEEEDTIFAYILHLHKALYVEADFDQLGEQIEKYAIQHFVTAHLEHDNMKGIQELTHNYDTEGCDLQTYVLIDALRHFHEEMKLHARIENEILLPKALQLEKTVKALFIASEQFGKN